MPKPRRRNSFLAFRRQLFRQSYRSSFDSAQRFYIGVEKNKIIRYYSTLDRFEVTPIRPPTLEQMVSKGFQTER